MNLDGEDPEVTMSDVHNGVPGRQHNIPRAITWEHSIVRDHKHLEVKEVLKREPEGHELT